MELVTSLLSREAKQTILGTFFDYELTCEQAHRLGESYFCYYQHSLKSSGLEGASSGFQAISDVVRLLKQPDTTRASVETLLKEQFSDEDGNDSSERLRYSLNLAVRLLLMIPIGPFLSTGAGITVSGETYLPWKNGTITEFVSTGFSPQTSMKERVRLEKGFNARNLKRIAGIEIRWTSNLADHLRMRDDDTAVEIFHYASFLRFHQNCHMPLLDWQVKTLQTQIRPIFPPAFIRETLDTLALLLPEHDKNVQAWFENEQNKALKREKLPLDPQARECGQLKVEDRDIDKFSYWHDRLVILKQAFDEAEPSDIKQWWCDRRRKVQWYTFWVAAVVLALTIIFGLAQTVEGGIQAYYTVHPVT